MAAEFRPTRRAFCALMASTATVGMWPASTAHAQTGNEVTLASLDAAEGMRAIKSLQRTYAQYMQYGLWTAIGKLFTEDGEARFGDTTVSGPDRIAAYLTERHGGGAEGLPEGVLHTQLVMAPVVTFSDATHATARWHDVTMTGRMGEFAHWAGNIQVNEYVKEGGVWKIARLSSHPIFEGPYEDGWNNVSDDLGVVPYHYGPDEAGWPYPAGSADVDEPQDAAARIAALNAEDEVRNLQNAYGYYLDRRMWDDIVDLFAEDGTLEILGIGTYEGKEGVRRWLERTGPAGLRHGEMFDHPQIGTLVEVSASADTAHARGIELGMTGRLGGDAFWEVTTFNNTFVKEDGTWKLKTVQLAPVMRTDYFEGWGKSDLLETSIAEPHAPDTPAEPAPDSTRLVPAFFAHPVTGSTVTLPGNLREVAKDMPEGGGTSAEAIDEAPAVALRRSMAWDAIVNQSSALGSWIDDFMWDKLSSQFSQEGLRRVPGVGFYRGPQRNFEQLQERVGPRRDPRTFIPVHLRIQPVIHVSQDATTAKLRTRLLQFNSAAEDEGSISAGMYEDELVLEDGIWRFSLDPVDHLWRTESYSQGWARVPDDGGRSLSRPPPVEFAEKMPPDTPDDPRMTDIAIFPEIGPLGFHYVNPVSGRKPQDPQYLLD